jgi:hypothetical protein
MMLSLLGVFYKSYGLTGLVFIIISGFRARGIPMPIPIVCSTHFPLGRRKMIGSTDFSANARLRHQHGLSVFALTKIGVFGLRLPPGY